MGQWRHLKHKDIAFMCLVGDDWPKQNGSRPMFVAENDFDKIDQQRFDVGCLVLMLNESLLCLLLCRLFNPPLHIKKQNGFMAASKKAQPTTSCPWLGTIC
jgi:hypothetical protein